MPQLDARLFSKLAGNMYLSELKLWNFRKYGINGESIESSLPGIAIQFHEGMNVLIGENDSGKTAIVDAIRYTLGTQSREWIRLDESDFHTENGQRAQELKMECIFRGFTDKEAGRFLEWLGNEDIKGVKRYILKVHYTARIKGSRIITDLRAGQDSIGTPIDGDARALLRITYLKPLRDADAELTPGKRSRFAQILKAHKLFQKDGISRHGLETIFDDANKAIEEYFKYKDDGKDDVEDASELMKLLNIYVDAFFPQNEPHSPSVTVSGGDLFDILQRLSLSLDVNPSGLGAANLLFMATELLLLQSEENAGLRLALIEELEAHLHPQAQLRLIHYLKEKSITGQYILTTHSTTMGASIPLENLILCKGTKAFPMGSNNTCLEKKNYDFLHRFLDATKANLFFARGVLLVEGDAENLLIPTLAKIIDRPLHRYGISIVNVGSTAFSHFVEIFRRQDNELMGIKVALITDMDVKPLEYDEKKQKEEIEAAKRDRKNSLLKFENGEIKVFVSPNWTLEYELALSSQFRADFYQSVLWAEKIANSQSGVPQESKADEINETIQSNLKEWLEIWASDPRKDEKIAFEIYKNQMLNRKISKAITAQVFARVLEDKTSKPDLQAASTLQYLLDAIYHVTEPREIHNDH